MKDFRGIKRQRSRNRKTTGNQNNPNRAYESNGPDGAKVRGNAQTIYEKYQQLARDANSSGDRVLAENHLQHAEHYFRLIRQTQPQRPVSEYVQRDPFMNGFDFDYEEETEAEPAETPDTEAAGEAEDGANATEGRPERWRDRNDRGDRNNRNRDRDRDRDRDRNRDTVEVRTEGDDGENGGRRETRRERYERRRQQRLADQEASLSTTNGHNGAAGGYAPSTLTAAPAFIASTEPLGGTPSRLDQPLVTEAVRETRTESNDASHLPAFLRAPAPAAEPEVAAEAPKRTRRPRRKAEDAVEEV